MNMTSRRIRTAAPILLSALLGASFPAEAGGLLAGARQAAAKRSLAPAPHAALARDSSAVAAAGKPHDVVISRSRHPMAASHIEHAQRQGQPTVLHIDREGAAKRRIEATGSVNRLRKPAPHYERDEYPPAFTREGGHTANVRYIDRRDNRGAGGAMAAQTRHLPDGSKIRILAVD